MGVFFMFLGVIMITSKTTVSPDDVPYQSIPQEELVVDIPHQIHSPLFLPTAEAIQIPLNHNSATRNPAEARASLRRISGVFLNSVGTSAVRRMELEHLTDLALSDQQSHHK